MKSGRHRWRTRLEGHKPGSDPRYSCGWHNRKNTFNKERRQFEKMSSFETQAAGLARPGFSGPQLPIPPPEDPEILGCSPPHPHPTALPASGARGTRTGDPSSAAAYFGVTPPQVSPAHPAAQVSKEGVPCGVGGRRPGERGPSRACAGCELGTRAQASVALRLPSGLQRARGPPGRLFPGSQPGPPPS